MKTRARITKSARLVIVLLILLFAKEKSNANNITISALSTVVTGSVTQVQFTLSWDNSWYTTVAPSNYDAAWVFVKYQDPITGAWNHLNLTGTNNSVPSGYAISPTADNVGAFIYRNTDGSGNNSIVVQMGVVTLVGSYNIRVFAIEMVNVPQASFQAGDGSSTSYYRDGVSGNPYTVTGNASTVTMGIASGNLNDVLGTNGTLATNYPVGYSSFYCMKYEITQGAYRDFLNTLTYTQQLKRTANAPSSAVGTGALTTSGNNRNWLETKTAGVATTTPAVYGCDANANNVTDETADGEWIACNFLTWMDLSAYLDWAGLRPITELEYEKACRGNITAVASEYPWGNANIYAITGYTFTSLGTTSEGVTTASTTLGNAIYGNTNFGNQSPYRGGLFATSTSNRITAGSSYYGIMEMSGNVAEQCVTTDNAAGRSFTGLTGNGALNSAGDADVDYWPGINGNATTTVANTIYGGVTGVNNSVGAGARGGSNISIFTVSYRGTADIAGGIHHTNYGGRGGR